MQEQPLDVFNKKRVLRSFLRQSHTFIKKETLSQVFSCEFCEISKSTFFTGQLVTTASKNNIENSKENQHWDLDFACIYTKAR